MLRLRRGKRCSLATKKTRCCRKRRKSVRKKRKACLRSACISLSRLGICLPTLLDQAEARWVMGITNNKSDYNEEYFISHLISSHDRSQKLTSPHEWPAQWCKIKRYVCNFCTNTVTKWNDKNNVSFQTNVPEYSPCLPMVNNKHIILLLTHTIGWTNEPCVGLVGWPIWKELHTSAC